MKHMVQQHLMLSGFVASTQKKKTALLHFEQISLNLQFLL